MEDDDPAEGRVDNSFGVLILAPGGMRSFELHRSRITIVGRVTTADICIDHPSISRSHANLWLEPDGVWLRDLGSRNGTTVNGTRLGEAGVRVGLGDQIGFGDVGAQLQLVRPTPTVSRAKWVDAEEFDRTLVVEAERTMRFGHTFGFLRIDTTGLTEDPREKITRTLRIIDVLTRRGPARFDVLLPGCDKEGAVGLAARIHAALPAVRIGAAAYPGDSPSPEALPTAAQLAMMRIERGVGGALEAARVLQVGRHEIVVAEPAMVRLFALIERVADSRMPVLIHGETGSGKEIVAEALHALGSRASKPLVTLNCAAMPEQLLESELFGHERGAFSGAVTAKAGLLEQADGGTLFLDEIAEMALVIQAKLLRVLENFAIRRVGGIKEKQVDVRIVAASHTELAEQVSRGRFREDLFYRLNSVRLEVPPLRERRHEIPLLVERFVAQAAKESGRHPQLTVTPEALAMLVAHPWPGNIRELRNAIRRAVMMASGDIVDVEHLPAEVIVRRDAAPTMAPGSAMIQIPLRPPIGIRAAVERVEREMIADAMREHSNNQTRAAAQLGITRQALAQKLAKYGMSKGE
jgi:two-component system response regulator AtoC